MTTSFMGGRVAKNAIIAGAGCAIILCAGAAGAFQVCAKEDKDNPCQPKEKSKLFLKTACDPLKHEVAIGLEVTGTVGTDAVVRVSGANMQVVSGSGATDGTVNGLGNLIVGYNEASGGQTRTGSHNLVVGAEHEYTSYGGFVAGKSNTITGLSAVVSGGNGNTAAGSYSSVSGGFGNTASGAQSSITGGGANTAYGSSSILGGFSNTSNADYSSISGGRDNSTGSLFSSVSGGLGNTASGEYSSVSGGHGNNANGDRSSISGGGGVTSLSALGWKAGSVGAPLGPSQFYSQ